MHTGHDSMMILGQPDGMYGDWRGGSRQQENAVWVQFKRCLINEERPFAFLERSLIQRLWLTGGLELHHLAAILVIYGNQWTLYWMKLGRRAYLHLRSLIFIIAWIRRLMTSYQQRRQLLLRCLRIIRVTFWPFWVCWCRYCYVHINDITSKTVLTWPTTGRGSWRIVFQS